MLQQVSSYAVEEKLHCLRIAAVDDGLEFGEVFLDAVELSGGMGVEEYLGQQVVVLPHQAVGNGHMALEGGARSVLMLHDAAEDECGGEGNREGVGYSLVVLGESIVFDMQVQFPIEHAEEFTPLLIALLDDDGVFVGKVAERGECGSEHGMCRYEPIALFDIEFGKACLHAGNVAEYGGLRNEGKHFLKCLDGVFHRSGIDDEVGAEWLGLFRCHEALYVECELQAVRIRVVDGDFVVEAEEVAEEGAHLSGSEYEDFHFRYNYQRVQASGFGLRPQHSGFIR